jgi:hypothetical protein
MTRPPPFPARTRTLPVQTERPLFAAAISCPVLDMIYGARRMLCVRLCVCVRPLAAGEANPSHQPPRCALCLDLLTGLPPTPLWRQAPSAATRRRKSLRATTKTCSRRGTTTRGATTGTKGAARTQLSSSSSSSRPAAAVGGSSGSSSGHSGSGGGEDVLDQWAAGGSRRWRGEAPTTAGCFRAGRTRRTSGRSSSSSSCLLPLRNLVQFDSCGSV